MTEVVIAHFSSIEVAELAASFLRRHGVKTRVPFFMFAESLGPSAGGRVGEYPIIVRGDQADKARKLLDRVLAGEFSEEGASDNSRKRLGAKLSEALLPAPGYEAPSKWEMRVPLLAVFLSIMLSIFFFPLLRLLRDALG